MDATLVKALQLVLSLSILVVLHEAGHFLFSKLFKVKVDVVFASLVLFIEVIGVGLDPFTSLVEVKSLLVIVLEIF